MLCSYSSNTWQEHFLHFQKFSPFLLGYVHCWHNSVNSFSLSFNVLGICNGVLSPRLSIPLAGILMVCRLFFHKWLWVYWLFCIDFIVRVIEVGLYVRYSLEDPTHVKELVVGGRVQMAQFWILSCCVAHDWLQVDRWNPPPFSSGLSPHGDDTLLVGANASETIAAGWGTDVLIIMWCPYLFLVILFALRTVSSSIHIGTVVICDLRNVICITFPILLLSIYFVMCDFLVYRV